MTEDTPAETPTLTHTVGHTAPPYPGAFCDLPGGRLLVWRTRLLDTAPAALSHATGVHVIGEALYARCGDGGALALVEVAIDGRPATARAVAARLRAPGPS